MNLKKIEKKCKAINLDGFRCQWSAIAKGYCRTHINRIRKFKRNKKIYK